MTTATSRATTAITTDNPLSAIVSLSLDNEFPPWAVGTCSVPLRLRPGRSRVRTFSIPSSPQREHEEQARHDDDCCDPRPEQGLFPNRPPRGRGQEAVADRDRHVRLRGIVRPVVRPGADRVRSVEDGRGVPVVPPSREGGFQNRSTWRPEAVAMTSCGAPGRPRGVALASEDRGPSPTAFLAEAWEEYAWP